MHFNDRIIPLYDDHLIEKLFMTFFHHFTLNKYLTNVCINLNIELLSKANKDTKLLE